MSIFDLVDKKIAIKCDTEEDARLFIDTAITSGLACNWNKGYGTGISPYESCVCYMFEKNNMYYSGYNWAEAHGYELIAPENISEFEMVFEEVNQSSYDVFTLIL